MKRSSAFLISALLLATQPTEAAWQNPFRSKRAEPSFHELADNSDQPVETPSAKTKRRRRRRTPQKVTPTPQVTQPEAPAQPGVSQPTAPHRFDEPPPAAAPKAKATGKEVEIHQDTETPLPLPITPQIKPLPSQLESPAFNIPLPPPERGSDGENLGAPPADAPPAPATIGAPPPPPVAPAAGPKAEVINIDGTPSEALSPTRPEKSLAETQQVYIINYNNVPIQEYLRFISKINKINFIYDEKDLDFNVTIVSEEPSTVDHIMSALLQILQMHGLSMAEQGNQILIYKTGELAKIATVVSDTDQPTPGNEPAIVTRVFRIQNTTPDEAAKIVRPLLSESAVVEISKDTSHLVVTDIAGNTDKVAKLLQSLDSPTATDEIGIYHVQNTYIDSLVALADRILLPLGGGEIALIPQPGSDTIYVIGSPGMVQRALSILQTLDGTTAAGPAGAAVGTAERRAGAYPGAPFQADRDDAEGTTFFIYKLQYHQGDEIKEALRDISESLEASGTSNADLISTIATIQWIQASNSLIISGNRPSINRIRQLLEDLDVPLQQVLIEVLVLRTTIANSLTIGVEWGAAATYQGHGLDPNVVQFGGGSTQGTSPTGTPSFLNQRLNPVVAPAPINPLFEGGTLGGVGRFVNLSGTLFTSIGAVINALQADDDTTVLLSPRIMTQDNHTARIFVGTNIAFRESTISEPGSTILSGEIQYRDVGSELIVTPILNNSDMVTLEVSQKVERIDDSGGSTGSGEFGGTTNPVLRSETETRVTVPDGYFLVISGQINDLKRKIHRGLPCLGGLPIIGTAFSTQTDLDSRDNLIIFLRPHIVRTKADMVRVTEAARARYEGCSTQREFQIDREEALELLNVRRREETCGDNYYEPCFEHDPCEYYCCD